MSDVTFQVCMSQTDAEEFQAVLREHGLTTTAESSDIQKSITPTEALVYIAICGGVGKVASAFEAYFKSRDQVVQIMTGNKLLYIKNYTPEDIKKMSKSRSASIINRRK